jgi:hypothetical protein
MRSRLSAGHFIQLARTGGMTDLSEALREIVTFGTIVASETSVASPRGQQRGGTIKFATFAACATVGNDSARITTVRSLFIKLSPNISPNNMRDAF